MSKGLKTTLIIIGVLVVFLIGGCSYYSNTYNKMITLDESVSGAWAQVQNVYQRRYDFPYLPTDLARQESFGQLLTEDNFP